MFFVISSPKWISFTTRTISTFWLMDLLNSGVTAKQMIRERMMQITPITVRFLKKFIVSSILCAFHNTNRYG